MCPEKEKIIMAVYDEVKDEEKKEILRHVNECSECFGFYKMLKEFDNLYFEGPSPQTDDFILSYSTKVISNARFFVKRFAYSLSFAVVSVFIIISLKGFSYYCYQTLIESDISEIEKNIESISYDMDDFSFYDFYDY